MDVILPVAGLGTRLRPQTWSKPKPLVSVAGKPILAHVLDRVLPYHPEQLVFVTGFLGDQIERWARDNCEVPLAFVAQPEMRGQCDAIIRARHVVPDDHDALILFPDMIFEADFSGLKSMNADGAMFTKEVADPSALGIAVVEGDRITKLVEKPKEPISNLAVIGIYYVKRIGDLYEAIEEQMANHLTLKGEYFIADAFQIMINHGKNIVAQPVVEWEDCGTIEALLATNRFLLDRDTPEFVGREGVTVVQPSVIAADAIIEQAVIGPYASIGPNAVIRNAIVRDAILEHSVEVESVIVEHSVIGCHAKVIGTPVSLNIGDQGVVRT